MREKSNQDKYQRIVVKIGSSSLSHENGRPNLTRIDHFLRQMVDLKNQGREVLFVTSGAIGAGMSEMGISRRPQAIPEQQGMAAIGQALLMTIYNKFLHEYGEVGAQILLTSSDLEDRSRFLNAFNTLDNLLKRGIIPIINENDTVATQEIRFGDNDTLSARVAGMVEADLLIILSDVEGLYNSNPRDINNQKQPSIIRKVEQLDSSLNHLVGGSNSTLGTGGMITKLEAAKIAVGSGITMVIGPGFADNIILRIIQMLEEGSNFNLGTTFLAEGNSLSKRKQWLCFNQPGNGSLLIDSGAEEALLYKGKSLLPGGILQVEGDFVQGDSVRLVNRQEQVIGKGLVNYSSQEIKEIMGLHSGQIDKRLGYKNADEVIHRDNLVIKGEK